jgi:TMEM151 family
VNSHVGRAAYDYSLVGVRDVSRRLVDLDKCPCTRVRLTKRFSFATPEAEQCYERQRAAFFGDHERRDDYVETREGVDLNGVDDYRDRLMVFADPSRLVWLIYILTCTYLY